MAADTRDIKINVTVDSDTRGSQQAAAGLEKVDKSAGNAGDALAGMAKESEKLDVQIAKTKARVKELEEQLVKTGDRAGGKGSLRRELNSERSWLRELERTAKDLAPKVSRGLLEGLDFSELVAESKGTLIVGGVALAGAMAPAIAGVLSSAIVGAVGLGGVVGGAVLASRDSRVKGAWSELGHGIMAELEPAGSAFVRPIINAADTFKSAFDASGLVETLQHAAVLVDPIAKSFAGFGANLVPGIDSAIGAAEPTWKVLEKELPQFGTSLSRFFGSLEDSSGDAAVAMKDFFDILEQGTESTGTTIEGLTRVYTLTRGLTQSFKDMTGADLFGDIIPTFGLFDALGKILGGTKATVTGVGDGFEKLQKDMAPIPPTAAELNEQWKQMNDLWEHTVDLQAQLLLDNIDLEQGLQDLADTLDENGATLDIHTDKGRENQRALIKLAKGIRDVRDDQISLGEKTADANATLEANKEALYRQAEAAGISREELDKLIGKILEVPPLRLPVAYTAYTTDTTSNPFLKGFAGGGDTPAFEPFRVHNGEVMFSDRSHYVATKAQVDAMSNGGGGGMQVTLAFKPSGDRLVDAILASIRAEVSKLGGDGSTLGVRTVRG